MSQPARKFERLIARDPSVRMDNLSQPIQWIRRALRALDLLDLLPRGSGALFGHCSSCGFSSSFASLGRFYEFERSPLCAGTGDDPKGHAGD